MFGGLTIAVALAVGVQRAVGARSAAGGGVYARPGTKSAPEAAGTYALKHADEAGVADEIGLRAADDDDDGDDYGADAIVPSPAMASLAVSRPPALALRAQAAMCSRSSTSVCSAHARSAPPPRPLAPPGAAVSDGVGPPGDIDDDEEDEPWL